MRALTLHNPWAILMATEDKRFETRSWGTSYRGPLAIHAAKMTRAQRDMCRNEPYLALLQAAFPRGMPLPVSPYEREPTIHARTSPLVVDDMPSGAIVALGSLVNCVRITSTMKPTGDERALGDWTPGRFAWDFRLEHCLLDAPIPARGYQSLWTPEGFDL